MVRQNGEDSSKRESRGRAKYLFEAMAGACILTQDGHTVRKHFRTGKASRQVLGQRLPVCFWKPFGGYSQYFLLEHS